METSGERDQRIMTVIAAARERPATERQSFLESACQGDLAMLQEILETLEWEGRMGGFLQEPVIAFEELNRPFVPGQVVSDRFEILREVGEGGMGVVYEAFDRKREQRICIKSAKLGYGRLLSPELESALRVRHPNICLVNEIHTARTPGGEVDFLTMEFLEGPTLAARLTAAGKLPPAEALEITRQICAGLSEAHRSGIIHRDLKCGNVILTTNADGGMRAVITDFGLAAPVTEHGEPGGTPRYMAPELWLGEKASAQSDMYALGVMLYEMVGGEGAMITTSAATISVKRTKPVTPIPPPSTGLPRWDRAVQWCLNPDPLKRPKSPAQLLDRLDPKPRSKTPFIAAAGVLVMMGVGSAIPDVRNNVLQRLHPQNARLAIIPFSGTSETAVLGNGLLEDTSERVRRLRSYVSTVVVIPPKEALDQKLTNGDQAREVFHATHALETSLQREGDGWTAQGAIIDLESGARSKFSGRYTKASLASLPRALAGVVSGALHLGSARDAQKLNEDAAAAYFTGLFFLRFNDRAYDQALMLFREAAALDPRSPLPPAGIVEALVAKYRYTKNRQCLDEARKSIEAAQSLNPDAVLTLMAAGKLEEAAGHYEKALEQYHRVQELEPRNTEVLRRMGGVFGLTDMLDKGIGLYQQAIALEPGYYATYQDLGVLYYFHGDYKQASEQFQNALDRAPGVLQLYINLGAALNVQGRDSEAEQIFLRSLKVHETPGALNSLGVLRSYQHRDPDAVDFYRRAVALDGRNTVYLINLADAEHRLGHAESARELYRRIMELSIGELTDNPHKADTRAYVAYCAARLGDRVRAEEEIGQALQLAPSDSKVVRRAVLTFETLGQRNRSLEALRGATPEVLLELSRHPDMAELSRDSRFLQMTGSAGMKTGGR